MSLEKCSTHRAMSNGLGHACFIWEKHKFAYIAIVLGLTLLALGILNNTIKEQIDRRIDRRNEMKDAIIVEFPLRGEWLSPKCKESGRQLPRRRYR